jgi:hypothetical protein
MAHLDQEVLVDEGPGERTGTAVLEADRALLPTYQGATPPVGRRLRESVATRRRFMSPPTPI